MATKAEVLAAFNQEYARIVEHPDEVYREPYVQSVQRYWDERHAVSANNIRWYSLLVTVHNGIGLRIKHRLMLPVLSSTMLSVIAAAEYTINHHHLSMADIMNDPSRLILGFNRVAGSRASYYRDSMVEYGITNPPTLQRIKESCYYMKGLLTAYERFKWKYRNGLVAPKPSVTDKARYRRVI